MAGLFQVVVQLGQGFWREIERRPAISSMARFAASADQGRRSVKRP